MAIRLRQICLVAKKLAPVIDDFKAVLGLDVCFKDPAVAAFGLENSLMPICGNFLEVVAPIRENTAAGRYLKRRSGDGGYMVICQCDSHETQLTRKARAAALDVRIAWEHEGKSFHGMQLHPADTGGSFLEIDWDARGEPEGHWTPAGGTEWVSWMHTDIVKYFTAAELQSPDPRRLAERWSSIVENPLRQDSEGRLEMPLENASVRFVQETDGRGEGLGGIDIVVPDHRRVLNAAAQRGLETNGSRVTICGVRFNLR
jgi:hypothetical protein